MIPFFREAAGKFLEEYTDPAEALARALAKVAGHTKLQVRCCSLSTNVNFWSKYLEAVLFEIRIRRFQIMALGRIVIGIRLLSQIPCKQASLGLIQR